MSAAAPATALSADALTLSFGGVRAVDGLSLAVRPGEIFGLLGHNGAGKTTTVRLLNGLLTPDQGGASVLGLDPWRQGPALRARTGVLTEVAALDRRLTGREILTYHGRVYGVSPLAARVSEMLEIFGLSHAADLLAGGYSKGMRQRLALARAFLHEPELLFLDEPVAALDPVAARQVHALILAQARGRGRTVLLCTHNLVEAERLCDRVAVLERGRVLLEGAPGDLQADLHAPRPLALEVHPEDTDAAETLVGELVGEIDGELDGEIDGELGGGISVEAPGRLVAARVARDAVPALVARLAGAGVRIFRVEPREPTLEEIYFALHEREGR